MATTRLNRPEEHLELGDEAHAFQLEVREWLAANAPAELKGVAPPRFDAPPKRRSPLARHSGPDNACSDRLHIVAWPTEYGGRGLSGVEVALLNEEFHRAAVPRITRAMGEWLVGPSIIVHGTEEQKAYFLPRIIDGTDRYCQGFSSPTPAPTSPACARAACSTATRSSSTARRSGRRGSRWRP